MCAEKLEKLAEREKALEERRTAYEEMEDGEEKEAELEAIEAEARKIKLGRREAKKEAGQPFTPPTPVTPPEIIYKNEVIESTNKEFIAVAGRGDVETVQMMLDSSPEVDVNWESEDGWTALIWAAGLEMTKVVSLLDEQGAVIDRENKDGYTALRFAAANGKTEAVKLLLELGADCNYVQQQTTTPFIAACAKGRVDAMRAMMNFAGPLGGAKLDLETPAGRTALLEASAEGQAAAVEMLLANGCKVQTENKWGRTALMEAALYGRCEILEVLNKYHAKIDAVSSKDGATAIGIAHKYKQRQAVAVLESYGVSTTELLPRVVESFRSRRDKVNVEQIVMRRQGEDDFLAMLNPGGSMEIPELRRPTDGHLAMVERDYKEKGLLDARPNSKDSLMQGTGDSWAGEKGPLNSPPLHPPILNISKYSTTPH